MRPALLFVSLVLAATGMFPDANGWLGSVPQVAQLAPPLRVALLHAPWLVVVAILWFYARIGPRVQGPAWLFVLLALLAVAQVFVPFLKPVVIVIVVALLLQLTPRIGTIYEASPFPSLQAFLGLSLLLAMSLGWGGDVFGFDFLRPLVRAWPREALMIAISAVIVAAFIVGARLRHRRVQPCGAATWLLAGIVVALIGVAARFAPPSLAFAQPAGRVLEIAGHLLLFVGAFLLLSHLLPSRPADEQH